MEDRPVWSHPDITLPHLLNIVRAFVDMLILASGYQPSGLPARWTTDNVKRALGWASLLEEIMKKVPDSEEGDCSRRALDTALQDMMIDANFPVGIPNLSCGVLAEAKRVLIFAMSHAFGSCNGQVESLLAAVYSDEVQDWEGVLQHVSNRCMAISCMNSLSNALKLATPLLTRHLTYNNYVDCCRHWRQKSLSYVLDGKTLYKLSGARLIFQSSELQWRNILDALQSNVGQEGGSKVDDIAELCCLQLSSDKWNILTSKLLEPCQKLYCSIPALQHWLTKNHNLVERKSMVNGVEAYLLENMKGKKLLWLNLPPILVAAALVKGSPLFNDYLSELSRHMDTERVSTSCWGKSSEDPLENSDDILARLWCLQFQEPVTCQSK